MTEIDLPIVDAEELDGVVPEGDIFAEQESEVPVLPVPYYAPFGIMQHDWYGTDGTVWNLSDPDKGVFIVQEEIEGMHLPLVDDLNRESPSVDGASFHGYRIKPRDVVWSVYIYTDEDSEAFYDLDRRFWDSMRMGQYGTWRVTRPDGQFRELRMRQTPIQYGFERDPGRFGWVKYPIRFLADAEPLWKVPLILPGSLTTFDSEPGLDFFGGAAGKGPQFEISPTRSEMTREHYNDGDEDVYPVYEIKGPMDFVDFSINGREYHVECDLLAGEWIKIDTHPRRFSITDDTGANRTKSISDWIFDSFKAKETTIIQAFPQGLGGGSFMIDASPLYHRAW